jgi:hypothetical protein
VYWDTDTSGRLILRSTVSQNIHCLQNTIVVCFFANVSLAVDNNETPMLSAPLYFRGAPTIYQSPEIGFSVLFQYFVQLLVVIRMHVLLLIVILKKPFAST